MRDNTVMTTKLYYFSPEQNKKCAMGAKPCLIFSGELFDSEIEYRRLKSLLIGKLKCQPRNLKGGIGSLC